VAKIVAADINWQKSIFGGTLIVFRFIILSCVSAMCLFGATGCGGPDSLVKKQIALINEQADAIEKKDAVKFQRVVNEQNELAQKFKELNLSAEEKKRLEEKYKDEMNKAMKRLQAAADQNSDFMRKIDPSRPKEK
jgi:hypothetical protein